MNVYLSKKVMINETLPFIKEFIELLNDELKKYNPNYGVLPSG